MPDDAAPELVAVLAPETWPHSEHRRHEIERLSRAVCLGWGWDPDRPNGNLGPVWQSVHVANHVLAYIAMRESDGTFYETSRG